MMSLADLDATCDPAGAAGYRDLWEGPLEALQAYRQQVKGSLAANQRLQDAPATATARAMPSAVPSATRTRPAWPRCCSPASPWRCPPPVSLHGATTPRALLRCSGSSRSETPAPLRAVTAAGPARQRHRRPARLVGTARPVPPARHAAAAGRTSRRPVPRLRRDRHRPGSAGRFRPAAAGSPGRVPPLWVLRSDCCRCRCAPGWPTPAPCSPWA